ncbi:hypothetical protein ACN5L5_004002 [Cronobacter turicensis]|uniref:hypothetical protein n=1 Tax=Cronobacter turicensis TaxID=413502 RepID=UPI0024AFD049|nr:hypothetical protein [Cronobacter turicensis]MDI7417035.1 hypothetical protein [Cronobacter turicensis]MDI7497720.1 hypothetical protein [Cronobacter turicensis]
MTVEAGKLSEEVVHWFFDGEDAQVKTVEVLLRPQIWIRQLKHGKERTAGAPCIVTPLVTSALLNREGFLFPASPATIPHDLLEPLSKGTFSFDEMAEYDNYKTTHDSIIFGPGNEHELREETDEQRAERYTHYQQLWQKYLKDSNEFLKYVAGKWLASPEQ